MFKSPNDRFKIIYKQGKINGFKIIQDTKTGMNYLFAYEGYAGGMTPLLDRDGKPVVTVIEKEE